MNHISSSIFVLLIGLYHFTYLGGCWRAVPANQAMYAVRRAEQQYEWTEGNKTIKVLDVFLPRDQLSFVYKFGWCRADAIARQFLRKSANLSMPTLRDQEANYLYLLETKHTIRYAFQCVVMKAFVNRKFLFYKSRLPLYYCQGTVYILLLRTINRFAIHELYLYRKIGFPVDFTFDFYQAPAL